MWPQNLLYTVLQTATANQSEVTEEMKLFSTPVLEQYSPTECIVMMKMFYNLDHLIQS